MVRFDRCADWFDREEFWEACIELDRLWCEEPSDLYQGLIFLSAAYHHCQRRNHSACARLLELAVEWLAPYAWAHKGSPLAEAVREAVALSRRLAAGGSESVSFPKLGTRMLLQQPAA